MVVISLVHHPFWLVGCLFVIRSVGRSVRGWVGWSVNFNYYVMKRLQFYMIKLNKIMFDEAQGQGQHV